MATIIKPSYGSSGQSFTATFTSLANNGAWATTAIDNSTTLAEDALIALKITSGASGTSATGQVALYGFGSVDGGTTYPEGITGTSATLTLTSPPNLKLLTTFNIVANSHTYNCDPVSFCELYGIRCLPQFWGIAISNLSAATFSASNCSAAYQLINAQLV